MPSSVGEVLAFARLFGRFFPQHGWGREVASVTLRVHALVPAGTTVDVTDLQLLPAR